MPHFPSDNLEVLKALIAAKADVSARDNERCTPLMFAADDNHVEAIKLLLDAGANLNDTDCCFKTALIWAALADAKETYETLLAAGADIDFVPEKSCTPALLASVGRGKTEWVKRLINDGADVNLVIEPFKKCILGVAEVMGASEEMMSILRSAGAKTWREIMVDRHEIALAASAGDLDLVIQLLDASTRDQKEIALFVAIESGFRPVIQHLLHHGVHPRCIQNYSLPAIEAARAGNLDILKDLLDAGATSDDAIEGFSPIKAAAKNKHREVVSYLLAKAKEMKQKENK
jgi:ankyrin repeat protein